MLKKILLGIGVLVLIVAGYVGYMMFTTKNHSPAAVAEFKDGEFLIQVNYCQPFKKGRVIFGEASEGALVPYGMKWRTGANEATEISFSNDVMLDGRLLKAGRYSLYTIPYDSTWTVVFNSKLGYWGAKLGGDPFEESMDVMRVPASVRNDLPEIEQFTISLTPAEGGVNMHFYWATTRASLSIQRVQ
ncbi:MAG: DUF2911 domain-containing protein [Cyclobacteriaceae bacterium]|nr:DUF2911 domain-containing protein [Cyclobacteriaceae bacterium]UYN87007.1 MAG: DUF2911 domain-containing protein [Cyclobacteriaceae bacterium]